MSNDNLNELFKDLEHDLDIENPNLGHEQRFLNKLVKQNKSGFNKTSGKTRSLWKPFLGIAASIVLVVALVIGRQEDDDNFRDLANVSPEMAETQDFFTTSINEELNKIQEASSPETKILIQDAMKRIKTLEDNYESLKDDLTESGDDNRVIYAMISNFQNRINILQSTLEQIKNVKQLKKITHETSNTL